MKSSIIVMKNYVYMFLIILSGFYLLLRIVSIILVKGFGFVIFFSTYEINLANWTPTTDLIISGICFTVAMVYFNGKKGVVISLVGLIIFMYSLFMWFPLMIYSHSLTSIETPSLTDKYAVVQYNHQAYTREERMLRVLVYKEYYPSLYQLESETDEVFFEAHNQETINSFNSGNYRYDEDKNSLFYGEMEVPLP